jgi:peptidylprolyl isomerase
VKRKETSIYLGLGIIVLALGLVACGPAQDPDFEAATATARAEGVPAEEPEAEVESESEAVNESAEETAPEEPSEPQAPEGGDFDLYAGLSESEFETTESGLQYTILDQGDGEQAQPGQVVAVHYTGWLEDGNSFDSSVDRGEPFSFALGQGMVIPGWDEGVAMLHVGDKARLIIPSDLAYGEAGRPGIPPDSTLIFDVELVSISEGASESPAEVDQDDYTVTDSGLQYYDLVEGDGPALEEGQLALMHFSVWLDDGTFVDSSLNRGQPIPMLVGGGQNIPGWEEGLMSMNVGGMRQMIIPAGLAFGEAGAGGGIIPPNATLLLELEVIEVQNPSQ